MTRMLMITTALAALTLATAALADDPPNAAGTLRVGPPAKLVTGYQVIGGANYYCDALKGCTIVKLNDTKDSKEFYRQQDGKGNLGGAF